ncbi:MAG: DUF1800 domain-containing protein [Verrucomicrobia bacterium]|nr:DUF1800 domain-containing protein [Verrucomicrobiota bacterium]
MLKPLPDSKWNSTTAAHLLNRAGFGGPPSEVENLTALGVETAVSRLVDYEEIPDSTPAPEWAKPDPTRIERAQKFRNASAEQRREFQQMERRTQQEHLLELRQWWLQRMAKGPRPLQEKLTLFWHGHFATSFQKVRDAYLMWLQNETFRRHAHANWLEMLTAVSKDPAMLLWLDQAQSRREHPNENFAREVMELFALGEGHYTEKDVTEAARALTGWSYDRAAQVFVNRPRFHDPGEKTVLGRTGDLKGEEVLEQIVNQPQAARFIVSKLWSFFASENPPEGLVDALAKVFRESGNCFKPVLRALFRSEEFYSDAVVRNQVKSPVQWLVGSVRMLELEIPPPFVTNNALRLLGQELFAPPNVKGWDGGLSWITTNNLLNRYNFAAFLVLGEMPLPMGPNRPNAGAMAMRGGFARRNRFAGRVEVSRILTEQERQDKDAIIRALATRLFQGKLRERQEKTVREYLDSQGEIDDADIRHAIRLLMSTPEFQLT